MGSTVLDFHASSFSDLEMEIFGLENAKQTIKNIFKIDNINDIDYKLFKPWFEYINKNRKADLKEIRIDELLFNYLIEKE